MPITKRLTCSSLKCIDLPSLLPPSFNIMQIHIYPFYFWGFAANFLHFPFLMIYAFVQNHVALMHYAPCVTLLSGNIKALMCDLFSHLHNLRHSEHAEESHLRILAENFSTGLKTGVRTGTLETDSLSIPLDTRGCDSVLCCPVTQH